MEIYTEGLSRTNATGGMVYMTFTPLMGMSDVVRRFLSEESPDRSDTNLTIDDAEHIPLAERERIIASYPAHEREARTRGIPMLGSGRIFPVSEELISIQAFAIPVHWPVIGGIDFGWDHPTAAVKLAWDRDSDTIYVTNCYRRSEAVPAIHAAALKPWGAMMAWAWPADALAHDKSSGDQLAVQYRSHGLRFLPEHSRYPNDNGNSVEAGIMDMLERMETGRWKVFANCADWFDEFRLYHRKAGRIVKERDDAIDASRYGLMSLHLAQPIQRKAPIMPGETHRFQQRPVGSFNWLGT